jgi:hypothetical protein
MFRTVFDATGERDADSIPFLAIKAFTIMAFHPIG